jgi:hypothetical protein
MWSMKTVDVSTLGITLVLVLKQDEMNDIMG